MVENGCIIFIDKYLDVSFLMNVFLRYLKEKWMGIWFFCLFNCVIIIKLSVFRLS